MNSKLIKTVLSALLPLMASTGSAKIELPDIISSNAVLQQNSDAKLWGWSKPGSTVTVTPSWDSHQYTVKSDSKTVYASLFGMLAIRMPGYFPE